MITGASQLAAVLGNDPTNDLNEKEWAERARIAREFNMELIRHYSKQVMFVIKVPGIPFLRRKVTWAWLLKPMILMFDRAVGELEPVEVDADQPKE